MNSIKKACVTQDKRSCAYRHNALGILLCSQFFDISECSILLELIDRPCPYASRYDNHVGMGSIVKAVIRQESHAG